MNSLYAVYENRASGFAERYLAMLSAGGTKHHSELLAPFGLDASDPNFWDGGSIVIAAADRRTGKTRNALVVAATSCVPPRVESLILHALHGDGAHRFILALVAVDFAV